MEPDKNKSLLRLSELLEANASGIVCVSVLAVSEMLKSRNGWEYRNMKAEDTSMLAEIFVSESKFMEWKFKAGDFVVCNVKSNGTDANGRLTLFFIDFLGPFETARVLYNLSNELYSLKVRSGEHMKSSETVYQISAREARSLMELIKLWTQSGTPQHYTKWCQMHQIVATNLYYMGLVKRTGSMSGYYYPTEEALMFFEGTKNIPKKRIFVRDKDGKHLHVSDSGESRSFSQYLDDFADRDSALKEYADALEQYREKLRQQPGLKPV